MEYGKIKQNLGANKTYRKCLTILMEMSVDFEQSAYSITHQSGDQWAKNFLNACLYQSTLLIMSV